MRYFVLALLAAGSYLGYRWYVSTSVPGTVKCPSPGSVDFVAILGRVADGTTSSDAANKLAQSYDNAGCKDAASAVRAAMPVKVVIEKPRLYKHTLSAADVLLTPAGFAPVAGYLSTPASCKDATSCSPVDAFLADNPSITKSTASPMPGHPEIYTVMGKASHSDIDSSLGFFALSPWKEGQVVNVKNAALSDSPSSPPIFKSSDPSGASALTKGMSTRRRGPRSVEEVEEILYSPPPPRRSLVVVRRAA